MKSAAGDPFGERSPAPLRARLHVLGSEVSVESGSASLLKLAVDAFGGLPRHRLAPEPQRFRVRLVGTKHRNTWASGAEPPRPILSAGGGLLCATVDAGNFAVMDPGMLRGLVCISRGMLRHPYHARYELIELAVLTLVSRGESLVPLHAACVGINGSGVLLMGPSGAGKSTLSLHALADGMEFLSEDSAFVAVKPLVVTGVSNYLHVHAGALGFLKRGPLLRRIRRSPTIQRRSGTRKLEVDIRELPGGIARAPLRLAATVFLSNRAVTSKSALRRLARSEIVSRLRREQPYAAGLSNWLAFEKDVAAIPTYELLRTEHPRLAVRELRALLADIRVSPGSDIGLE